MIVPGMACKPSSAVQIPCSFAFKPNLPRSSHRHRCHPSPPRFHVNGHALADSQTQARQVAESPLSGRAALLRGAFSSIVVLPILLAAPAEAADLPANYVKFARKLISALKDSVEADMSPASEAEVRRKADPAKVLVKEWVANWRDARVVSGDTSFKQIKGEKGGGTHVKRSKNNESLQLLGDFYLKKGQRTRLPTELGSELLRRLDAASAALPAA